MNLLRLALLLAALLLVSTVRAADPVALEFFEKNVRPVLVEKCVSCPGAEKAKGGLRLDTREEILKGGERGPGIVSGKPRESVLLKAIRHTDEELKMPPSGKLADREIAAIEKWVEIGA